MTGLIAAISFSPWKSFTVTFRAMGNRSVAIMIIMSLLSLQKKPSSRQQISFQIFPTACKGFEAQRRQTLTLSSLALNILKCWKTNLHSHPMLEKPRQQDPSSNTVRCSLWDWEDLECVDTADAGAAWREEQMASTKNSL